MRILHLEKSEGSATALVGPGRHSLASLGGLNSSGSEDSYGDGSIGRSYS